VVDIVAVAALRALVVVHQRDFQMLGLCACNIIKSVSQSAIRTIKIYDVCTVVKIIMSHRFLPGVVDPNNPPDAGAGAPNRLPAAGAGAGAPNNPPVGAGAGVVDEPKSPVDGAGVPPNKPPPAAAGAGVAGVLPNNPPPPVVVLPNNPPEVDEGAGVGAPNKEVDAAGAGVPPKLKPPPPPAGAGATVAPKLNAIIYGQFLLVFGKQAISRATILGPSINEQQQPPSSNRSNDKK
jgi:hypothetical protein